MWFGVGKSQMMYEIGVWKMLNCQSNSVLYTACELRIVWYDDEVWCSLHGESLVIKGVISPIYRGYNSSYLFIRPFIGVPYAITPNYNWWRTHLVALAMVNHLFFCSSCKMFCFYVGPTILSKFWKTKTWQVKSLRSETFWRKQSNSPHTEIYWKDPFLQNLGDAF